MRKGDIKRNSILEVAEKLFFERGYEQTSVQDILDELSLSKGGFYHHFQSKEAILEEICENHAVTQLGQLKWELYEQGKSPIEKLNLLLRKVNLLDREDAAFSALMLKVCYIDDDVRVREHMRGVVNRQLLEYVEDTIEEGIATGVFYSRNPKYIGGIILGMVGEVNEFSCRTLAADADNPECVLEILDHLNACRDAVETLIGAPFASILLFDPVKVVEDYRAAASELLKLEEK